MSKDIILELSHISKSYFQGQEEIKVLKDINLKLARKELAAIIGVSGSGKSTLLHIAGLLDDPSSGDVKIDGKSVSKYTEGQKANLRLNKIGFIYQFHYLLEDFTVEENIILPQLIKNVSINQAKAYALELLAQLKLEHKNKRYPNELSGGEKQRVAVARALANKPEIIFADEPTGSLDFETTNIVADLLIDYLRSYGAAMLLVTHNQLLAKKMDIVYRLLDGKLSYPS